MATSRRGNRALEIRLDDDARTRWQAAADADGRSLSDFVRVVVDESIGAGGKKRSRRPKATTTTSSAEGSSRNKTSGCGVDTPRGTTCKVCRSIH